MAASVVQLVFPILLFGIAVESASILAVFSSLSFADHMVFRGYVSLLTQRGHSVAVVTPYPGQFQHPDIERIVELNVAEESIPFWDEYKKLMTNTDDFYPRMRALNELSIKLATAQLKSKQVTALFINPNIKFDLIVTEADIPMLYAIAEKYKAPHISITTSSGKIHQYESKGTPVHPILYPDVNTLNYRNASRWQKLVEVNRHIQTRYEYYNNYLPSCEAAAKKIFDFKEDLQEIEYNIDMLFVASNPALIGNRPTVPAITYVDRMHIRPGFQLHESLKKILDAASNGAVYFSLGAIQESEHLSPHILQTLSDAFRELPFTVLWKIGNTTVINKSDNVFAEAWFPQQEILAHPNIKAFITHGGARSLEEAVFYQVPIVGLPIIRSRKTFMGEITKYGAGEILDLYYLEKETVKSVLTTVVTSESYKKSMSKLKSMVEEPILSGPDNAIWWTEYVIRNGGARHFRSPAVGISFVKYYMLDVISLLLAIVITSLTVTFIILRCIVRRLRARFWRKPELGSKFKAL